MKNTQFLKTLLEAFNRENMEYIIANGGNISTYLLNEVQNSEHGYYWYLTSDEIEEYETDLLRQSELEEEVSKFIVDNYDYDVHEEEED